MRKTDCGAKITWKAGGHSVFKMLEGCYDSRDELSSRHWQCVCGLNRRFIHVDLGSTF